MDLTLPVLQAAGGGLGSFLFPMVAIVVIFWFFIFRPQMKRQKQHQAMVSAVARGDTVTTAGGLIGKVTRVQDNEVEVEVAPGVKVRVVKHTLSDVQGKNQPQAPAKKVVEKK